MKSMRELARRLTIALFKIDEIHLKIDNNRAYSLSESVLMYALDDGKGHSQLQISEEWLIPKTTLNTIVKKWEVEGLLTLSPIAGKRREKEISLTELGRKRVTEDLQMTYRAKEIALQKVMDRYSEVFVDAVEYLGQTLQEAYEQLKQEEEKECKL